MHRPPCHVLLLLVACGEGGGSPAVDGGPLVSDAGDAATIAATLLFATGETLRYEAPVAFELAGGLCSCTGADAAGAWVAVAWMASHIDDRGSFPLGDRFYVVATQLEPFAKYSGSDGTVEITRLELGTISGTFSAAHVELTSWMGTPPDPTEQLQVITEGTFTCTGRSDGVYATCFQ